MTVFISKDVSDLGDLPSVLKSMQIKGIYHSLIQFDGVSFDLNCTFEVIFFPSVRAAQFLLNSKQIDLSSYILACSGRQTEKRLRDLGYDCEFVGENAGNPDEVSRAFSAWLGQRKVLIPHSNLSSLSIGTFIRNEQMVAVEVYKTLLSDVTVDPCELYVFSSPSNIQSFFKTNRPKTNSKLVVWGQSSLKTLKSFGYDGDFILKEGTLNELKNVLKTILIT